MSGSQAPPQFSPDGRWWWDGTAWVPAEQAPTPNAQPEILAKRPRVVAVTVDHHTRGPRKRLAIAFAAVIAFVGVGIGSALYLTGGEEKPDEAFEAWLSATFEGDSKEACRRIDLESAGMTDRQCRTQVKQFSSLLRQSVAAGDLQDALDDLDVTIVDQTSSTATLSMSTDGTTLMSNITMRLHDGQWQLTGAPIPVP